MITTAVAADEPPEPQPPFATGGIVPAGSTFVMPGCGEYVLPVDSSHTDTAGNVHVTVTIPDDVLTKSLRAGEVFDIARHCCPYGAGAVRPGAEGYTCPRHGWQRL